MEIAKAEWMVEDMDEIVVKEKIKAFVLDRFPLARTRKLQTHDLLLESGVLDSLGVLDVVGFTEKEFSIQVSDEELVPDNFQTIDSLTDFVLQKRGENSRLTS
jgi:acyl carrier protein